jgi:hypothetical protein
MLVFCGGDVHRQLAERLTVPFSVKLSASAAREQVIIRWGLTKTAPAADFTRDEHGWPVRDRICLNPAESVRLAMDKKRMRSLLVLHGIPAHTELSAGRITYSIPVFDLAALAIFAKNPGAGLPLREIQGGADVPAVRRAKRLAVRAVYSLGLDFAVVAVSVDDRGRPAVADVNPAPSLNDRLGELFAQALNRYARDYQRALEAAGKPEQRPLLGMDPEFLLSARSGKVVSASKFLGKTGEAGCEAVQMGGRIIYPLAELRPAPAKEPEQLLRHLLRAMRCASERIRDRSLLWLAGGMPRPGLALGGHLHLSGIWLSAHLLRVFDNYLALPLVLIEDDTTGRRRPRYGFLGDFRRQFHGGFEYRTLPSWIVSPRAAKGVLALARLIADHYLELKRLPLYDEAMVRAFYAGNKPEIVEAARVLWTDLERLPQYGRLRQYIEPLKRQMLSMQPWNEQRDIRKVWKLPPYDVI